MGLHRHAPRRCRRAASRPASPSPGVVRALPAARSARRTPGPQPVARGPAGRRTSAVASAAPVRQALDDITVAIASTLETSSTTIAAVGAYVVVVATTLPDRAVG